MILATIAAESLPIESLIRDLAFILILGAVVTVLFKWLRQPVVLGYIVAGFLASPHFEYLPSVTTDSNIEFWAQIGIVVLLFSLGLEFSFKKLVNAGGSAVVTAMIIVAGMMCGGFVVGHILGFSAINCLFLGGMLSMSSTTIIIKAFNDLGLQHKKFASLVFAVLIVEDLFAVVMMVLLSSIAVNSTVKGGEMLFSVMKLVFFLIMWFATGVFVLPSLLNKVRRYLNSETLLIMSMGLCLGMAVFSVCCGFSLALGAFVMGSILAGTSFAERIERVVTPVKDLFGSVFFISVGMMVDPHIITQYWAPILVLSGVVIFGMILLGTFGMLVTGQNLKVAIEAGFSLTQIGEFAFIIATLGMSLGVLDPTIYPIVVAVSVLTTFTTPYFIRMADPAYGIIRRLLPRRLHFLIDRYTESAAAESETGCLWRSLIHRYLWRVMLYSAVLVAMALISQKWVLPWLTGVSEVWGPLLCALLTLAAMTPFPIAQSFTASKRTERQRLIEANAKFDVPLVVMTFFRLLIGLAIIIYTLSVTFSVAVGFIFGIFIFMLLVFGFSRNVRRRMRGIESRFIDNLNERELRRSGRRNNVVGNLHMAFMTVGYDCPFVGERLQDSDLRRRYGVSIANIQRGAQVLPVPSGDTRIFPGDVLGVIGTDEEIQKLLPIVEATDSNEAAGPSAHDFKMTTVQISASSPLAGKTVGEARLSKDYSTLLVAIDRNGEFITPVASTRFEPHDIIWAVAPKKQIARLK